MTQLQLSVGVLLISGAFLACTSTPGGKNGGAGQSGGAAGTTGQAGTTPDGAAPVDATMTDASSATQADGRCVVGAYARDGVCMCQSSIPSVCASHCVNLQVDPDYCGDCNTKCGPTSVCNAGHCGPAPTVVVAPPARAVGADGGAASCGPLRLQAAGTALYWTDTLKGTVNSIPTGGGTPTVIASGQLAPTLLQVVGANIFWLNSGEKKIMKSALAAGTPTTVVTAPAADAAIGGFVVTPDGLTVYFSSTKTLSTARPLGTISKVPAAGGTVTIVGAEDHGVPGALALDGTTLAYPVSVTGDVDAITVADGKIAQCGLAPVDGGVEESFVSCNRLGRSQGQLVVDTVMAAGGKAYWLNGANLTFGLTSVHLGSSDGISSIGTNVFTALTLDGTASAYLTEEGTNVCHTMNAAGSCVAYDPATPALIQKASLAAGGTKVALARFVDPTDPKKPTKATSVAVDATQAYYATVDCGIFSVPK